MRLLRHHKYLNHSPMEMRRKRTIHNAIFMTAFFPTFFFLSPGKKKKLEPATSRPRTVCTEREEGRGETRPSVALAAVSLEASLTAHHYPAFSLPLPDHSGEIMLSFFSLPFSSFSPIPVALFPIDERLVNV